MKKYLVTGASGAGKTTLAEALKQRGYYAVDADSVSGLAKWGDSRTGKSVDYQLPESGEWDPDIGWIWDKPQFDKLLSQTPHDQIFLCGGARNQHNFYQFFDKIFFLSLDNKTTEERLIKRTNNPFGKHPLEVLRAVNSNAHNLAEASRLGMPVINASDSIEQVVEAILAEVNAA